MLTAPAVIATAATARATQAPDKVVLATGGIAPVDFAMPIVCAAPTAILKAGPLVMPAMIA
jgi:hypothetical protein